MKIRVVDAFGALRGVAVVEWQRAEYLTGDAGPHSEEEEAALIFPAQQVVSLPTHNVRMPWRLEVER